MRTAFSLCFIILAIAPLQKVVALPASSLKKTPAKSVDIYWASNGVPHITGADWYSLGVGAGYAVSSQNFCIIADQILKIRSERSKYFGAGENSENIITDVGNLALGYLEDAQKLFPAITPRAQQLISGYTFGYNKFFNAHKNSLPEPCTGAAWITAATPQEFLAYYLSLAERASGQALLPAIVNASAPVNSKGKVKTSLNGSYDFSTLAELPKLDDLRLGSNAWGFGKAMSENGRGILLGNPHFPAYGALRFYQQRLRIPGVYDVQGVSILGTPCVEIGFDNNHAWTHTVSKSRHFTMYELELNPENPLQYKFDNEVKQITSRTITIQLKLPNQKIVPFQKEIFFSHFGPLIATPDLKWDRQRAYSYRDANRRNIEFVDQWLDMGTARNLKEFKDSFKDHHGTPWVNTIYADRAGNSAFMEGTPVPKLTSQALAAWKANPLAQAIYKSSGSFLLQGNTSRDEWMGNGLTPFTEAPRLDRSDFVLNSNDSHWLTNFHAPLTGFSPLYGPEGTQLSYRTRMSNKMVADGSGENQKFNLLEVEQSFFANRSYLWEDFGTSLVQRCKAWSEKLLADGCAALSLWDGRYNLTSRGVAPFREFASGFKSELHQVPFSAKDPLRTPSGLIEPTADADPVKALFSQAVASLSRANINPAAAISQLQLFLLPDFQGGSSERIPYSGGQHKEGAFNIQDWTGGDSQTLYNYPKVETINAGTGLSKIGYPIDGGTSFLMLVEFLDRGPHARGLLTYSQSSDPNSPYFSDQNHLYSAKKLRDFPHNWTEILERFGSTKQTIEF